MSIAFFRNLLSGPAAPGNGREVDAVGQIVERARALVDQPRDVAFDRWLGDPERAGVQALVKHAHACAIREQDLGRGPAPPEEHEQRP